MFLFIRWVSVLSCTISIINKINKQWPTRTLRRSEVEVVVCATRHRTTDTRCRDSLTMTVLSSVFAVAPFGRTWTLAEHKLSDWDSTRYHVMSWRLRPYWFSWHRSFLNTSRLVANRACVELSESNIITCMVHYGECVKQQKIVHGNYRETAGCRYCCWHDDFWWWSELPIYGQRKRQKTKWSVPSINRSICGYLQDNQF